MKKLVTSPLSGTIYWATVNESKGWMTGEKKDVTDNAIEAVLDHLLIQKGFKDKGFTGYSYKTRSGGNLSICAYDERHIAVAKELYDELLEYKSMYEGLCK